MERLGNVQRDYDADISPYSQLSPPTIQKSPVPPNLPPEPSVLMLRLNAPGQPGGVLVSFLDCISAVTYQGSRLLLDPILVYHQ